MYYYIIYVCSISEIDPCELSYKRLVWWWWVLHVRFDHIKVVVYSEVIGTVVFTTWQAEKYCFCENRLSHMWDLVIRKKENFGARDLFPMAIC